MIRFCDREVYCIEEESINRSQLLTYFLDGHREEKIYVVNTYGKYVGSITYESLLGRELEEAICREYLVLNESMWEQGRKYLASHKWHPSVPLAELLPVLNKNHEMTCFAWQDSEANRELRMLEELLECPNAVTFKDIYPEYDCVTIYGCNELAYFFANYLLGLGVKVKCEGSIWEEFNIQRNMNLMNDEGLDYRTLYIYSEGITPSDEMVDYRKSASVEFECIDKIYEANIVRGNIKDTEVNFLDLLPKLHGKSVAILDTSIDSFNAYDLLLEYGIDIYAFVGNKERSLFGKRVLDRINLMNDKDIIFIDPYSQYSAWGFGGVDTYHYLGYKRNKQFFLLKDYLEVPYNGLKNVLSCLLRIKRLVLIGDPWYALRMKRSLDVEDKDNKIVSCDILGSGELTIFENTGRREVEQISVEEIKENDSCLILLPEQYVCQDKNSHESYCEIRKREIVAKVSRFASEIIEEYTSENRVFMDIGNLMVSEVNEKSRYRVAKILIGAHEYNNGNFFFRSLLDGHQDIIMLDDGYLSSNIFSLCIRLSTVKNNDILSLFWKLCYSEAEDWRRGWMQTEIPKFNQSMKKMLSTKEYFTSQELFIMIHIAFAEMMGKEIKEYSSIIIYWEPHGVPRDKTQEYTKWLSEIADDWFIIKLVRNYCIKTGSLMKYFWNKYGSDGINRNKTLLYFHMANLYSYIFVREDTNNRKVIEIKFEDLKCEPKRELLAFCEAIGIAWSDTLLATTLHGNTVAYGNISGFDVKPVHNTNDDYFSIFDHFRISVLAAFWQKRYGYPFVSCLEFSRRELQEIFMKEFRFEDRFMYRDEQEKKFLQSRKEKYFSQILWMARRMEVMEK